MQDQRKDKQKKRQENLRRFIRGAASTIVAAVFILAFVWPWIDSCSFSPNLGSIDEPATPYSFNPWHKDYEGIQKRRAETYMFCRSPSEKTEDGTPCKAGKTPEIDILEDCVTAKVVKTRLSIHANYRSNWEPVNYSVNTSGHLHLRVEKKFAEGQDRGVLSGNLFHSKLRMWCEDKESTVCRGIYVVDPPHLAAGKCGTVVLEKISVASR